MISRCKFLLPLFLLFSLNSQAQKDWNNWCVGSFLGINFSSGNRTVYDTRVLSDVFNGIACVSHPKTGDFLFATNGKEVFDRNFEMMSQKVSPSRGFYSFIVPYPGDTNRYFVFTADDLLNIYYTQINIQLRGGMGDIEGKMQVLRSNADPYFTAVKRLYDDGYWFITHGATSNEFQVFSITRDGLSLRPVKSNAGGITYSTWVDGIFCTNGSILSNYTGTGIVHCYGGLQKQARAELLHFDKKCGTLSYVQNFIPGFPHPAKEEFCNAAFSPNEKYLYLSWGGSFSTPDGGFYQYDLEASVPDIYGRRLSPPHRPDQGCPQLALAPDGLIYATSAENNSPSSQVSLIHDPNLPNAYFVFNETDLSPGYKREIIMWPPFILDRAPTVSPKPLVSPGCSGEPVNFTLSGDFLYDSLEWDTGDGHIYKQKEVQHTYLADGDYIVTFSWYLCGNKYTRSDTIKVATRPVFNLGTDTLLCHGEKLPLTGPKARSYLWSNGDSTNEITASLTGSYQLRASNYHCDYSDSIKIDYRPFILVELGIESFLCEEYNELLKLDAGKGYESYRWTPTGDTTQWITVSKTGDYYVIVKDFHGCQGDDEINIQSRCPVYLELPNTFTPNNDGINDFFTPVFIDVRNYQMVIYDRWGAEIFVSENPADGWDGSFREKQVPEGVYFYRIQYIGYHHQRMHLFSRSGTLHLLR